MEIPWSTIASLILGFGGGGGSVIAYLRWASDDRGLATTEWQRLYEEQARRFDELEGVVDDLQRRYKISYRNEVHLKVAIDRLITRIDGLLDRLAEHEDIPEHERDALTRTPVPEAIMESLRTD